MKKTLNTDQMIAKLRTGRYQAIVKEITGRRMFLGIERTSKRSRKTSEKFMCSPQDLGQLVARMKREKAGAEIPPSILPPTNPSEPTQPSTPESHV